MAPNMSNIGYMGLHETKTCYTTNEDILYKLGGKSLHIREMEIKTTLDRSKLL